MSMPDQSSEEDRTPAVETAAERRGLVYGWVLGLSGAVVAILVIVNLIPGGSSVSRGAALVGKASGAPEESALPDPRDAPEASDAPEEGKSIQLPGDLLSDLAAAFQDGNDSELVQLENREDQELFDRMRGASRKEGGLDGLTLFRLNKDHHLVDRFEVRDSGAKPLGVVGLERVNSRWHLVGIRKGEAKHEPPSGGKASLDKTPSSPLDLLEHDGEAVHNGPVKK